VDEQLQKLIKAIFDEHQDGGIDCETCSQQLNCLAELVATGAELRQLLPAVEAHLRCCEDCREEYQALLCILRAELNGLIGNLDYSTQKDS
jgi:hypothetical protein